ncbi:hypothetical protein IQ255_09650 [Pleurocapsales cyanobacterium LEGE 10410]|nr:hypothetical protein [Pleurocapsales cyanobacterium LEGE 10410]
MSDNNMDDLLAQLKTELEPSSQALNRNQGVQKSPPPQSTSKLSIAQMLDELSKEIQSGRLRPDREPKQDSTPSKQVVRNSAKERDRLNALIDADYQKQAQKREAKLAELKRQEEAKIAEQQRRQQELIEAQKREELRERRRKEALREKARQWLKNLNPRSEEGQWFEEFSYSYEDKLQAAIDYLEAMRESGL